jgi:protein-S-isoprenylcysteine O-methyltransferase Ste14
VSSSPQPLPSYAESVSTWSRVARRVRIPLGFLFTVAYLWLARPTPTSLLAGGVVLIPGLLLRALASGHVQKDKQLTTSGPYAYTRNPLYLGSLLLAVGFAIAARNWWIVTCMVVMFAAIYIPVIAGEERYLRRAFSDYEDYARHVPRLFPRLTRYGDQRSAYSSERYWKHHEYEAVIGCVVVMAILIAKLIVK